MSSFDRPAIYSAPVLPGEELASNENTEIVKSFKKFILEFRLGSKFVYRDQLRNNLLVKQYFLKLNIDHLINYNEELFKKMYEEPVDVIPLFETGITEVAKRISYLISPNNSNNNNNNNDNNNNNNDNNNNNNNNNDNNDQNGGFETGMAISEDTITDFNNGITCQLILESGGHSTVTSATANANNDIVPIRQLNSSNVSKIVKINGIIVSSSLLASRASKLTLMCRNCKHTVRITLNNFNSISGNTSSSIPKSCLAEKSNANANNPAGFNNTGVNSAAQLTSASESCGNDPYLIIHEQSTFIDQQFLKIQELPESVPIGEMPRNILMTSDRYLTNKLVPGKRVSIIGIYSIYQSKNSQLNGNNNKAVAIRSPYLKILGISTTLSDTMGAGDSSDQQQQKSDGDGVGPQSGIVSSTNFNEQDEQLFLSMSRDPNIYERMSQSIAPSIYGNLDIKKAIICLLVGGSKKILPDGMRLRGDINVLLLGDPGTAKSQLLKFVEKAAPISVYTSGKGSSAAGLTASVQRDPTTRDFYLEGGAMVLADGGVVCIDEFDKMRDEDRVAIHEAMEQQTISVAKAGITTVLNSRTSVLAAANPIYGRYDDMKSPGENIDFQTTILSRFDMIFIVKDEHNEQRDISIANHVMNIHTGRGNNNNHNNDPNNIAGNNQNENSDFEEVPIETLKKYVSYCRAKCAPRLSQPASERLSSHFVNIRKQLLINELEAREKSSIPITIRQLEAIIRITESLAKLELSPVATEAHVNEAIRLFQASTMDAASQDPVSASGSGAGANSSSSYQDILRIEQELKRRLPIGWSTSYSTLRREFVDSRGYAQSALDKALYVLERQETIQMRHQRQNIYRAGV
ncbi:minichromosome maintenance protein 5 [Hanseniaspora osmophila]|uniref:DNA replication licensing factor MCM5 n=1 Tax=Hanseniaspora osmophila TaxID=56408 RepID=A0A1E5RE80_9ASCO|nr:Minichromosome maintenance protein 5 [Hanseniaspora osmophila]